MIDRPGVLIYFDDVRPVLHRADDQVCGALFRAVFDYAQYGVIPDTLDPFSGLVFDMMRPKIDRDLESYKNRIWKSTLAGEYSAYKTAEEKSNRKAAPFDEWRRGREAELSQAYSKYKAAEEKANRLPLPIEDWRLQPMTVVDGSITGVNAGTTDADGRSADVNTRTPTAMPVSNAVRNTLAGAEALSNTPSFAFSAGAGEVTAGGCKGGGGEGELIAALIERWQAALDAKDMTEAMSISSQLFRAGYNADPKTRKVIPRTV